MKENEGNSSNHQVHVIHTFHVHIHIHIHTKTTTIWMYEAMLVFVDGKPLWPRNELVKCLLYCNFSLISIYTTYPIDGHNNHVDFHSNVTHNKRKVARANWTNCRTKMICSNEIVCFSKKKEKKAVGCPCRWMYSGLGQTDKIGFILFVANKCDTKHN